MVLTYILSNSQTLDQGVQITVSKQFVFNSGKISNIREAEKQLKITKPVAQAWSSRNFWFSFSVKISYIFIPPVVTEKLN